jgi:ankyrin repeat protein
LSAAQRSLWQGADPRISSSAGSPLIVAANAGHLETVKYLVFNAGCSTREQNSFGRTPLHQAVRQGHFEVAF